MDFTTYNLQEVEKLVESQPDGKNTKFLKSSHSLWYRFKNYDKNPPFVLEEDGRAVALVFITFSERTKYANLYEIVTLEGMEGNGFATDIWVRVMQAALKAGMERLKISCTPTSITWHNRNGLIFWAVDPSGSLRADQPIFKNIEEQLMFRELALKDPSFAIPPSNKVVQQLKEEGPDSHGFGEKKRKQVRDAIEAVGEYWFREALFEQTTSLEDFF